MIFMNFAEMSEDDWRAGNEPKKSFKLQKTNAYRVLANGEQRRQNQEMC
jgi:hypothetical protein